MTFTLGDITMCTCNWLQARFTLGAVNNFKKYYPQIPVIVVDDGSDDPTSRSKFETAYRRAAYSATERFDDDSSKLESGDFKLIKTPRHMGHGSALDYGVDAVETPLILTMDNDIRLLTGGLVEEYLEKMNEDSENVYAVGTTYKQDEQKVGKWIDPWFSLYQVAPIRELHLTFSNFISPSLTGPSFHIGTGAFIYKMLTYETLHRPQVWKAVHYPEPEKIDSLWHLKKFPEDTPGVERYDKWHALIDG